MKDLLQNNIVFKFFLSLSYCLLYSYIWINFCHYYFDYIGYSYNGISYQKCIPSYLIALIPVFFYSGLKNISSFLSIILYLFAYIPIVITLQLYDTFYPIYGYQIILMFFMILFFCADKLDYSFNLNVRKIPFSVLIFITFVITLYLVSQYWGRMKFLNFKDIYDLRDDNKEIASLGINGYFLFWLAKIFYPVLLLVFFYNKKYVLSLVVSFGFVLLYMMTGQKAILLTPFLIISFHYFLKWKDSYNFDILNVIIIVVIIFSLFLLSISHTLIGFSISALFFMRTLCICGFLFPYYIDFFTANSYTYFSHISIVNKITGEYPYSDPLGVVVSDNIMNANAMFWTTDGIASYGHIGLIIISVIFFIYLIIINGFKGMVNNKKMIYLVFIPSCTALLNSSFFTYIITHGIFLLILIFLFFKIPVYEAENE